MLFNPANQLTASPAAPASSGFTPPSMQVNGGLVTPIPVRPGMGVPGVTMPNGPPGGLGTGRMIERKSTGNTNSAPYMATNPSFYGR